jgi:predicted Zn finger-like uncharacterized protein
LNSRCHEGQVPNVPTIITFQCPNCQASFRIDSIYSGRNAKCKRCGQRLRVPGKALSTPAPRETTLSHGQSDPGPLECGSVHFLPEAAVPDLAPPVHNDDAGVKRCPSCAEQIPLAAIHCQHCVEMLDGPLGSDWGRIMQQRLFLLRDGAIPPRTQPVTSYTSRTIPR